MHASSVSVEAVLTLDHLSLTGGINLRLTNSLSNNLMVNLPLPWCFVTVTELFVILYPQFFELAVTRQVVTPDLM